MDNLNPKPIDPVKLARLLEEEMARARKYDQMSVIAVLMVLQIQMQKGELDLVQGDGSNG